MEQAFKVEIPVEIISNLASSQDHPTGRKFGAHWQPCQVFYAEQRASLSWLASCVPAINGTPPASILQDAPSIQRPQKSHAVKRFCGSLWTC